VSSTSNTRSSDQFTGALLVLGAITAWGIYFPFAIILLRKLSVAQFLVLRWGIGALTLLSLNLLFKESVRIKRRDWPAVLAAIAIGIILHQLIQVNGLRHTSATNTGWILTLIPPVTGLLGWIFLKETVHWRQTLGLAVAIVGVVLFVSQGYVRQLSFIENQGDVLVLLSVFTWSGYTVLTKSRLKDYGALPLSLVYMAIGFLTFLALTLIESGTRLPPLTLGDWLLILVIGVFPSGFAYYWWNAGLQRLSAINTSMFLFIEAIFASIAGALLLGESFTPPMAGFAVLIAVGVYISQTRPNRGKP
jgi:drug/metabolite transporter (DMT)-like permease